MSSPGTGKHSQQPHTQHVRHGETPEETQVRLPTEFPFDLDNSVYGFVKVWAKGVLTADPVHLSVAFLEYVVPILL